MAWEISISPEGWQEIYVELQKRNSQQLVEAIIDDKFELVFEKAGDQHATLAANAERNRISSLPIDILVDRAFELIQRNNTCDNGGFAYWIDRDGHHRVCLNKTQEAPNEATERLNY